MLVIFINIMTLYVSAMYRSTLLIVMAVNEIVMLIILYIWVFYMSNSLSLGFKNNTDTLRVDQKSALELIIKNRSILPISRFSLRVNITYSDSSMLDRLDIMLGAMPGESKIPLDIRMPYSGSAELEIKSIKIWDYLKIFSITKVVNIKHRVVVLPRLMPLSIHNDGIDSSGDLDDSDGSVSSVVGDFDSIREYNPGDTLKMIHWKVSCKSDDLFVKTYSDQSEKCEIINIDLQEIGGMDIESLDVVYTEIYNKIYSRIVNRIKVKVICNKAGEDVEYSIKDQIDLDRLFIQLESEAV